MNIRKVKNNIVVIMSRMELAGIFLIPGMLIVEVTWFGITTIVGLFMVFFEFFLWKTEIDYWRRS